MLTQNFSLSENFLPIGKFSLKGTNRKRIFTIKFRKPGWNEQSKVVSECILKCNFFILTDALNEYMTYLSHHFSIQSGPKKRYHGFIFAIISVTVNIQGAPILTIFSLLEQEIYDA